MPHSARSLPPDKRHSRLTVVRRGCNRCRIAGIHGEAMYTAPDCAACAALQASDRQCRGSRGPPLAFSWGFKGAILSRERMAPFPASPRCGDLIAALRAAPFTAITRSGTLPQPPHPRSDTAARPWRKTSHSPRRIRRSSADATLSRLRFRHSPASRSS